MQKDQKITKKTGRSYLIILGILPAMLLNAGIVFTPPSAHADPEWTWCTPRSVMTGEHRLHVRCEESVGGISFFAASTEDPALAARYLSSLSTAMVAGKTVQILYDPADLSGAAFGCQTNDCRVMLLLEVWK